MGHTPRIDWAGMYADWEKSGMTKSAYARSDRSAQFTEDGHSVTASSLYSGFKWVVRRRISDNSTKIPVRVHVLDEAAVVRTGKQVTAAKPQRVVIQMPGGAVMHFDCADAERFAISAMLELREAA